MRFIVLLIKYFGRSFLMCVCPDIILILWINFWNLTPRGIQQATTTHLRLVVAADAGEALR